MTVTATEDGTVTALPTELKAGDLVRVASGAQDKPRDFYARRAEGKVARLDFLDSYSGWFVRPLDGAAGNYVAAEFLTKVSEVDVLRDEVASLTTKLAQAVADRGTARTELSAFQESVRSTASDLVEDDSDNADPLNALLEALGLAPLEQDFEITVRFDGSYTVTISATDEDSAREQISTDDIADYLRDSGTYLPGVIDDYSTEGE